MTHDEIKSTLQEAHAQIEYLHEKFQATGSGNQVLAKLATALRAITAPVSDDDVRQAVVWLRVVRPHWGTAIEKLARENAALRAERDDLRQYAKNADKAAFEIAQNYWAAQRERDSLWDALDVARAVARTAPTTGGDA